MKRVPKNMLISVVDDDESVRSGTASLLRSAGYVAETFSSAEEFLNSGDHHRFACVVADIQMPGMSGIELANRLGHDEPPTPVILVTARTEHEVHAKAAASNAAFLLRKPFAADRLLQCLQSVMS
jgi:FixJ family two-component response regulator